MSARRQRNCGYTLIGLLIAISVLMIATMATVNVAEFAGRRAAEAELVEIGGEFDSAFQSYYKQSPVGTKQFPNALSDLIKDPRFPGVRRHLRRIYRDPLTTKSEWGTIAAPGGGIMGVYSLAEGEPIQQTRPYTATINVGQASKPGYASWKFGYFPGVSDGQSKPVVAPPTKP